ncbi:tryptophan RNA-binding attenuator protein-like domain-containing protein [Zopfochytrium polystomum]|nr:tryptophan RNA-binding attenuator protein-like domain-containing protein [Zopfochytrium polystomum]
MAQPQELVGKFAGGYYSIDHRDTNTVVTFTLEPGRTMHCKPGSLVACPRTIQIRGDFKFSLKKAFQGDQLSYLDLTGPGAAVIGPQSPGDILPIFMDGRCAWYAARDGFLAMTDGIQRVSKSQGIGKMLLSGGGLYVHEYTGQGVLFVESFGAVMRRDIQPGEEYLVQPGNLVAWNCRYEMESINAGGFMSTLATGESLYFCKFTGPGTLFYQTRSPEHFARWMMRYLPERTSST